MCKCTTKSFLFFAQEFSPDEDIPINRNVVEIDIELFGKVPYRVRLSIRACFKEGGLIVLVFGIYFVTLCLLYAT